MILTLVLIFGAFFALAFLLRAAKGRPLHAEGLTEVSAQVRPVDVLAFRNLVDPREEDYLRARLPARAFRKVQRKRLLAAIAYVTCVAENAAILLRLGEAARSSADPEVVTAGQELVDAALRLRLYSLLVIPKLYLGVAFPSVPFSPAAIADKYQHVTGLVGQLGRMHYPSRTARISAAL
jgi:hypothetical protein